MEVLLVCGAGLTALAAARVALSGAAEMSRRVVVRRVLGWAHALLRLVRRAASSPVPDALLRAGWVRARAERLSAAAASRGLALDDRAASVVLAAGLAGASVVVGTLLGSPVAAVAAASVLAGGALAGERSRAARARREVAASMPGVYRTLSLALGSGQTLAQAVSYVAAHERGQVAEAFTRMSLRLRCGSSTEEAVALLARELAAPGAGLLATALVISHRTGSPLRDLLTRSAALAERQGEFERMLGVKTAQVRLSVRIVCLLPAVMIALLALISPDFQTGLLTPAGVACVSLAALLDGVALLLIRRLMGGVRRWM